jgi:hypothetical protein
MRANEFTKPTVTESNHMDADQVLQYVKKTHAPEPFNIEYSITDHPAWELKNISLSQLNLDPDGEQQDPYNRTNWVDYDVVRDLMPKIAQVLKSKPIVVDSNGWIIDGNHRAMAAAEAGLTSVPALVPAQQDMAENKAAGINKMFNNLGDPVYANLQRVALLAMQGRQSEAAGRLQTVIKHADPAVQKKITDAVNNIKPVTINGRVADSSTLDKSKQHNDWITNTFIPWVQSLLGHQDVTEAKTVEFEGLTLKVIKQEHELTVDALDDWGNKVLGHVKFNIGDGKELDPQDLRVDDKYQGQGIARVMYDYVKSLGYTINRSWDQTDAGAGFWNKHRGEDVRVWEQDVAEARKNPEQNTKYQSGWAELAAWARKNNVWLKPHEWAISMTYVPKLGINPGPGISEDTPRGIYFYPFQWAYSVKMDKEALPWADNAPYIQLFQYSTGTELYDPNQIPLASAVAQLKNYGITDEDIAAEKENNPSISTYNLLVWCLGRKYDDNKRVTILNKVLRNLGYDYMIDNGKGWIAINEPTQGVVLNPKIIDKVVTFNNYTRKKEQGMLESENNDTAISLSKLGKFHPGADTLAEFVPERATAQYALHPDKWESTFYSLTNKDSDKLKYYGPKKISIPPGTLVGDMAIANKFYRAKTPEEQEQYAELYKASLQPYPVDVSEYRMPELLIPQQSMAENFADGKNPGRKGLAKRSGVNTKASVSSLRKTAKNSSGEKQRMAHWLANMKAGRAKAKRK